MIVRPGHLRFGVGREDHERHLDAPVGGVGDVRNARQAVELDVVLRGGAAEHAARRLAQVPHCPEVRREGFDRGARRDQQFADERVALAVGVGRAPLLDLVQTMVQRVDQRCAALRVVEQVVLEVGIALHDPDVAEHLVEHACRAAGAALAAQLVQQLPSTRTQQTDHDLAVGERGVVVRNLAQARGCVGVLRLGERVAGLKGKRCIHRDNPMLPRGHNGVGRTGSMQGLPPCP
jgi:hypothetical protein